MAVQDIACAVLFRCGRHIGQVIAALRLAGGEGINPFARGDATAMFFLLGGRACHAQQIAAGDDGWDERLNHQAFAKLFHDDERIDRATTKATHRLRQWGHHQTHLSHFSPDFRPPASFRMNSLATCIEIILLLNQLSDRVPQHVLFVGKIEIHVDVP